MKKRLKLQNMKRRKPEPFRRDWWSNWMKETSYLICLQRYFAVVIMIRYCALFQWEMLS
jgi:hypothetical protein